MSAEEDRFSALSQKLDLLQLHSQTLQDIGWKTLNGLNALEMKLILLQNDIKAVEDKLSLERHHARLHARADAVARGMLLRGEGFDRFARTPDAAAPTFVSLEAQFAQLRARAPLNFDVWFGLFEQGRKQYEKRLPSDLSTPDHPEALLFRSFLAVHARGRVLDIGVGPLAKPLYLEDMPNRVLGAIDPLPPFEAHPFGFAQSVAEFLPWGDASFDTVVAATSLDHVYLLDTALDEFIRVLSPNGRLILWSAIYPETQPYDPYSPCTAIDEYHLFHPGENWFPQLLETRFRLVERYDAWNVGFANSFLCYEKR